MYFSASQISLATWAFAHAESMVSLRYRLDDERLKTLRYDVKTLAYLEEPEKEERAFAHLCRYRYESERKNDQGAMFYFYRICLQDSRILDAVNRTSGLIQLPPLLLYIAAHELIHVIRFDRGDESFEASLEAKEIEEQRVHAVTREILSNTYYPGLKPVLECFSDRLQIGGPLN